MTNVTAPIFHLNRLQSLWRRVLNFIADSPASISLTILPTYDPYVWILVNTQEQVEELIGYSDAVIIGTGASRQEFSTELHSRSYDEIDPSSFEFDPYRDQERLKLEREGHKKLTGALIREDTHKNNLPRQNNLEEGMGNRQQTQNAAHPLLASDPRFAGVEPNVSPLPDVNENADEQRIELQNKLEKAYTPQPSSVPILTNTPLR